VFNKTSLLTLLTLTAALSIVQPTEGQAAYSKPSSDQKETCCDRAWLDVDYLYWKIKDSPESVPLVVEQPIVNGPAQTVLGGKKIDTDWRSGARFILGYWFDNSQCLGIEANYFFLGDQSKKHTVRSDENGSPRLRVPYFNVTTEEEDSSALATPGLYRGTGVLKLNNTMQGAELNLVLTLPTCNHSLRLGLITGFRYWNFDERLKFFANSPIISPPSVYNYYDKFHVENNFYGGQLGADFEYAYCSFFLNVRGKVALGATVQETAISGRFETNEFTGTTESFKGGFFALPTNIGRHRKTHFSVIPEIDLNFGYQITDCMSLQLGYSILYVTNVIYAGKQINPKINPTQSANIDFTPTPVLVGEPSPKAKQKTEGLWAQGLNVGLEFNF
jgi:hypothetical protein